MGRCSFFCRNGMVIVGSETLRYRHLVTNISGLGDSVYFVRARIHRVLSQTARCGLGFHEKPPGYRILNSISMSSRLTVVGPEFVVCFFIVWWSKTWLCTYIAPIVRRKSLATFGRCLSWSPMIHKKSQAALSWQLSYYPRGYFLQPRSPFR